MLLILDLDETLVHARRTPLDRPADFECAHYAVYKRPGLEDFIKAVAVDWTLGVWTAGSEGYARCVVDHIWPEGVALELLWCRDRCKARFDAVRHEAYYLKDLNKLKRLGHDLDRVVAVDNTPLKYHRHYGNLLCVADFEGDAADDELAHLARYLRTLRTCANVRAVEKRDWRRQLARPAR